MAQRQITTYLFDLGGVLVNYDLQRDTEALQAVGLPLYSQWSQHPELQRVANLYLNGLLPAYDFCRQIRPFCRPGVTDAEIEYSMIAVMADLPRFRLERLAELRRHARVYLLSNINVPTWRYCAEQFRQAGFAVEDCFDRTFLSFELQVAKPDPAIFRHVIAETGLQPEATLYLDDDRKNIQTGRDLGFQTYLVPMNDPDDSIKTAISM